MRVLAISQVRDLCQVNVDRRGQTGPKIHITFVCFHFTLDKYQGTERIQRFQLARVPLH